VDCRAVLARPQDSGQPRDPADPHIDITRDALRLRYPTVSSRVSFGAQVLERISTMIQRRAPQMMRAAQPLETVTSGFGRKRTLSMANTASKGLRYRAPEHRPRVITGALEKQQISAPEATQRVAQQRFADHHRRRSGNWWVCQRKCRDRAVMAHQTGQCCAVALP